MTTLRFKIRVDEREHDATVELDPETPGRARVEVDGKPCDTIQIGEHMTVVRTGDDASQTSVALEPGPTPGYGVVGGMPARIAIQTAQEAALREALDAGGRGSHAGATIAAPMPGRIVKVLVAPGDAVEVGTPTLIMEAMKMENELRADVTGTVTAVNVAEGDTVDAGQVLCELTPQAAS